MAYFSPLGNGFAFVDSNGNPLSGALLFTYLAGSSTKQTVYKNEGSSSSHTNPIVLDANGRAPDPIWLTAGVSYKFVLAPSNDTDPPLSPIETWDDIDGVNDTTVTVDQWVSGPTPTFVSTVQFTLVGDQTSAFHVGRRLKLTDSGGTDYATISASAYTSLTTVTVVVDSSGVLDAGLSAVSYALISASNTSVPGVFISGRDWTHQGVVNMSGKAINFAEGSDVTSAATTDIWSTTGNTVHVTGSTGPITSLGTAPQAGASRWVIFDSTPTLTHGANLNIQGGANVTAAAGDFAYVYADTTTQHDVLFFRASGVALGAVYPANEGCAWDLIATSDIASSAADIYTNLNDTYAGYVWVISRLRPVTDNVDLTISLSTDNGSTYLAGTTYQFIRESTDTSGTETIVGSTGTSVFTLAVGQGNGAQETINGIVTVLGLDNPDDCAVFADLTSKSAASVYSHVHFAGVNTNGDVDALKFAFSSGNITSARITQYGIRRT